MDGPHPLGKVRAGSFAVVICTSRGRCITTEPLRETLLHCCHLVGFFSLFPTWFVFPVQAALQQGVIAGRQGFGSIFVVASGNGGQHNDNCNYDGYANSIYTITIGKTQSNCAGELISGAHLYFGWGLMQPLKVLMPACVCIVGAVDEMGRKPFYAEECASMLAVTFSSGGNKLRSIVCPTETNPHTHNHSQTGGGGGDTEKFFFIE